MVFEDSQLTHRGDTTGCPDTPVSTTEASQTRVVPTADKRFVIRLVAPVVVILGLFVGIAAELANVDEQASLGYIGREGYLDSEYRVHGPGMRLSLTRDFPDATYHRKPGWYDVYGLPLSGDGGGYVMLTETPPRPAYEICLSQPDDYGVAQVLFQYHQDVILPLDPSDGLLSGRVLRTIHAGRSIIGEPYQSISSVSGSDDTYEVTSDSAVIRLSSGRIVTLARGKYGNDVFHPLRGAWGAMRRIGFGILAIAAGSLAALALARRWLSGADHLHAYHMTGHVYWAVVGLMAVGVLAFLYGDVLLRKVIL